MKKREKEKGEKRKESQRREVPRVIHPPRSFLALFSLF
jgi:hypothetical protein